MARYLGALATRLARIEAERTALHVPFTTMTGRSVSLHAREVLGALSDALAWLYDTTAERPSSRALETLATVDPDTEPSMLMGTAVRAAHSVVRGERP